MHVTARSPAAISERAAQYLLLCAMFTVSFSTWLTNVFVGLTLITFTIALLGGRIQRQALTAPPALLALALLAFLGLASAWSIAPKADIVQALSKYLKLLMLPMAVALCWGNPAMPRRVFKAFLAGAVVLALSCYLVRLQMMPTSSLGWWRIGDPNDSFSFKNHITIGILIGFATVACLLYASHAATARARYGAAALGLFFLVPVIFLTQGRTGYLAVFIGLVTLFLQRVRLTPLRVMAGLGGIVLLFAAFYVTSDNFKLRTDTLVTELQSKEERTPNGLRLSYMRVGLDAIAEHPLGLGTGSFATAYAPTAAANWPPESELHSERHQPHSEFILMGVQLGLPGLALYFGMIASLVWPARRRPSFAAHVLALLAVVYVACSSFNSLLWDPTEGYWFLILASSLYVAVRQQAVPESAPKL
jgi:O-antigen ligase